MQRKLAFLFQTVVPTTFAPAPFGLVPLRILMQHHLARSDDTRLAWLKERIGRAALDA